MVVVAAAAVGVVCRCRRGGVVVVVVVVVGGVVVVALSCQAQGARGGVANLSMPASWRGRRRRAWRVVTTSWWLGDKSAVGLSENFNLNLVLYSYTSLSLRVGNLYSEMVQCVW